ncbi:MAG: N-acetylglutaminylglutamine amidotransferase [Nitriliruptorales bacterium]|nr:N-acetylglutaminylglutamine amidotransferase [Nitriliruptorales bacterium]
MCGISGEFRLDGGRPDERAIQRMMAAQVDRGPDGQGSVTNGPLALGHCRLAVIDLSERSAQPMVDPDLGLTISFNGCIYNYPELRRELQGLGYAFRSSGDTEVLLKAYHRWGDAFVERLQGMFAFCLHDQRRNRLLFARDRLGIKPLYLSEKPGRLRFASSLPALLVAGDVDTSIDEVALHHYLSFHAVVPAPLTILRGVGKLPPATTLVIEADGSRSSRRFWEPSFTRRPEYEEMTAQDWQDTVLDALRVAVRRRLVADVPVGVLLSGGLDSSMITALLAQEGQHALATFSVGFESVGGEAGDEFFYSDLVAATFETDHQQIRVPTDRMLPALGAAVAAMNEPMVSHDAVGFYLLSEEVARSIKVVQSGQGADEVFAGYHWYPPMMNPASSLDTYAAAFFDRDHETMSNVVSPEYRLPADVSRAFAADHFRQPGAETPADQALRLDTTVMLVDDPVKRVDSMTMAWGLEARVPFLDHELVELAAACPPELKIAQGGKGVLKDAARRILPAEVIDRPKGYFPVPALTHLQGPYLDLVRDALTAPEAKERGLFIPEEVDRLVEIARHGGEELTPLRGNTLWQLGLLELWLQAQGV